MLKDLLKKELRQFWLSPETSGVAETLSCGQATTPRARMNGADGPTRTSALRDGATFWPSPRDVLTTARAASGM